MYVFQLVAYIGNDAALGDLPVAVESAVAAFMDADSHTVQIEIGQLAVGGRAQIDAAVHAKGKDIHQLGVVRMVDGVGKSLAVDDGVYHRTAETSGKDALVGGVYMTVQDARDVIAAVYTDELAAQGIAVAVFKEDLFADARCGGIEIHRDVFAVEIRQLRVTPWTDFS